MKEINGIPSVIEGIAYYPQILVPNEKFKPAFYEVNLAVSDEVFDKFKSRGYKSCFPAGDRKYTLDPVVVFKKFAYNKDGSPNAHPRLVDAEGEDIDINIGNGSKIRVQWKHIEYKGKGAEKVKRAELVAAQLIEVVEWDGDSPATRNEEPDLEF
jgi:hypothetical protein|tara:strand:- start:182 stop:646 length:465 start_codon:yes stop_codon:yes gene_type:complete